MRLLRGRRQELVAKELIIGPDDEHGIPESAFRPGYSGLFTAASGSELSAVNSQNVIRFSAPTSPSSKVEYIFKAEIEPSRDNLISFNIRNRNPEHPAVRHPDIYPRLLVAHAILHFEGILGQNLTRFEANWNDKNDRYPASDNYLQYMAHLAMFEPPHTPEQRIDAASTTWTADVASENGFNIHDVLEVNDGRKVFVDFRRPADFQYSDT